MRKTKSCTNLQMIKDKTSRNITFLKRKRGFMKKAIELATLCAQDISISIYDMSK